MKSIKKGKIILIYLMACLIYCIWLPTYIKTTTPKPTFSEYLAIQGISIDNFKSAMETLNKSRYVVGTSMLQVEARRLLGNDLGNKVRYEYKQLVVDFNGDIMTMNKIRQMSSGTIKGKYGTVYDNSGSNINDNL